MGTLARISFTRSLYIISPPPQLVASLEIVITTQFVKLDQVIFASTLLASLAATAPSVCSQSSVRSSPAVHSISVRLLDFETGKPVSGVWVPLSEVDERGPKVLNAKTNSQGVANFQLPQPLPDRIQISFAPDEFASCSEIQFMTDQILKTGVVAGNTCKSAKPKPSALPASSQLVIFGKRITLWQRIRREIP